MNIDKDKQFTPRRVIQKNGQFRSVYADHFTIEIKLSEMPKTKLKVKNTSTWNLKQPGGWDLYKDLSDKKAEKIESTILDQNLTVEETVKKIESIEKEVKFAFCLERLGQL